MLNNNPVEKSFLDHLVETLSHTTMERVQISETVWSSFTTTSVRKAVSKPASEVIEALKMQEIKKDDDEIEPLVPADSVAAQLHSAPKVAEQEKRPSGPCTLNWEELTEAIRGCTMCKLSHDRVHSVIERGSRQAKVMFIGDCPNKIDESSQQPFSDESGELLNKMIAAMGLGEHDYYITQVVKCRPSMRRAPTMDEGEKCNYYLQRQIELIKPEAIVLLGHTASVHSIRNCTIPRDFSALIGTWFDVQKIPAMLICSPAYILSIKDPARQQDEKRRVWNALQAVMARLSN